MAGADRRILSTSEIAEVLGVTDRWVRELEKAGIINKISRGKFDLVETVQNYIAWLKSEKEETEEESSEEDEGLIPEYSKDISPAAEPEE